MRCRENGTTQFLFTQIPHFRKYFLKAQFHFHKDQFTNLMIISGIAGLISQLILMPILTPLVGEEKMLSLSLFFSCAHMVLYSIACSLGSVCSCNDNRCFYICPAMWKGSRLHYMHIFLC